jgi:hypothetical protein
MVQAGLSVSAAPPAHWNDGGTGEQHDEICTLHACTCMPCMAPCPRHSITMCAIYSAAGAVGNAHYRTTLHCLHVPPWQQIKAQKALVLRTARSTPHTPMSCFSVDSPAHRLQRIHCKLNGCITVTTPPAGQTAQRAHWPSSPNVLLSVELTIQLQMHRMASPITALCNCSCHLGRLCCSHHTIWHCR